MKYLYYLYQLLVVFPLIVVVTIITAIEIGIGMSVGNPHFWGYYPGRWWAHIITRLYLLPVTVEGREQLEEGQSYVFVANHQGAFDIFLIYGFLGRNFKWMMKHQLRQIPFVGYACERSHQIFVDKRGASRIRATYDKARQILAEGQCSVVVFPEGARSFTGHMGDFRRGAFMLADELQLPVVPLTINGSFDVLPRQRRWPFATWHPLRLTIHQPIYPVGQGQENVMATLRQSYDSVMSALVPEHQGYVANPDQ